MKKHTDEISSAMIEAITQINVAMAYCSGFERNYEKRQLEIAKDALIRVQTIICGEQINGD